MPVRLASPLEWVNIWYIMPQMDPDWRSVERILLPSMDQGISPK